MAADFHHPREDRAVPAEGGEAANTLAGMDPGGETLAEKILRCRQSAPRDPVRPPAPGGWTGRHPREG